jgi:ABC-type lipoprotein release transport system permease subunit
LSPASAPPWKKCARFLRSLLFEVDPVDPVILTPAALSIFLLALAASTIPAYRAGRIEPAEALRAN